MKLPSIEEYWSKEEFENQQSTKSQRADAMNEFILCRHFDTQIIEYSTLAFVW